MKIIECINLPYIKMQRIKHKNLPKIYYASEHENKTYVLEEYLQGMNLEDYIRVYGRFNEPVAQQFAIELCECLKWLHAEKIIHRDIKPLNLFLTNDKCLKLIDFDASRFEKYEQAHDTKIIGTEGYAAPEQYGFKQTDERTDIYALGMTLQDILIEPHSDFMKHFINKCIEFDPKLRFQNAETALKYLCSSPKSFLRRIFNLKGR